MRMVFQILSKLNWSQPAIGAVEHFISCSLNFQSFCSTNTYPYPNWFWFSTRLILTVTISFWYALEHCIDPSSWFWGWYYVLCPFSHITHHSCTPTCFYVFQKGVLSFSASKWYIIWSKCILLPANSINDYSIPIPAYPTLWNSDTAKWIFYFKISVVDTWRVYGFTINMVLFLHSTLC